MARIPKSKSGRAILTDIDSRSPTPNRRRIDEISHWTKGVELFNQKLSAPLQPTDRDAIWAAAAMLGVITFASTEALSPESFWPLAPSMSAEPEWLKMGQGKDALWRLVEPDRPDSIFRTLLSTIPTVEFSLANIPPGFIELYQLKALPAESSPYARPLATVFAPCHIDCRSSALALFYKFIHYMGSEFGCLVLDKDPRALRVMVYWYAKICTAPWWLRRRALMEGKATCLYLERFCSRDASVLDLLKAPRDYMSRITL